MRMKLVFLMVFFMVLVFAEGCAAFPENLAFSTKHSSVECKKESGNVVCTTEINGLNCVFTYDITGKKLVKSVCVLNAETSSLDFPEPGLSESDRMISSYSDETDNAIRAVTGKSFAVLKTRSILASQAIFLTIIDETRHVKD